MTIQMLEDIQFEIVWDDQRLKPPKLWDNGMGEGAVFHWSHTLFVIDHSYLILLMYYCSK